MEIDAKPVQPIYLKSDAINICTRWKSAPLRAHRNKAAHKCAASSKSINYFKQCSYYLQSAQLITRKHNNLNRSARMSSGQGNIYDQLQAALGKCFCIELKFFLCTGQIQII